MNTRDGKSTSPWEKAVPFVEEKDAELPKKYNVLIVGAGITGITTALMLQNQGLDCLLIDTNTIGAGTTGGTSAHINTFLDATYPEIESDFSEDAASLVAKATKEAITIIKNHIDELNIDADFEEKKAYLYAEDEKQQKELDEIYEASKRANVSVHQVGKEAPLPMPFINALMFDGQAQFHPIKYISGLLKEFLRKGGEVLEHTAFKSSKIENDCHLVQLGDLEIFAEHLVYATHIPPGINLFNFSCAPYRSYVVGAELKTDYYPDSLWYDMQEPYHYWRTHVIDGKKTLLVGGEDHKTGQGNPTEALQHLKDYVRKYFEVDQFTFEWSSQYYIPVDGLPYIGKMPMADENTWVATGFNGNGMIWGTISAKMISDLIIGQPNDYEDLLNPSRIKPVAGFKEFVTENANVAWHFVADRFTAEQLKAVDALAPHEGVVVDSASGKVAVSKSASGHIKAISAVCTHAGCIVKFNKLEQSWDCPCHGGRYDIDGKVVTGPPLQNLEKLDWSELKA